MERTTQCSSLSSLLERYGSKEEISTAISKFVSVKKTLEAWANTDFSVEAEKKLCDNIVTTPKENGSSLATVTLYLRTARLLSHLSFSKWTPLIWWNCFYCLATRFQLVGESCSKELSSLAKGVVTDGGIEDVASAWYEHVLSKHLRPHPYSEHLYPQLYQLCLLAQTAELLEKPLQELAVAVLKFLKEEGDSLGEIDLALAFALPAEDPDSPLQNDDIPMEWGEQMFLAQSHLLAWGIGHFGENSINILVNSNFWKSFSQVLSDKDTSVCIFTSFSEHFPHKVLERLKTGYQQLLTQPSLSLKTQALWEIQIVCCTPLDQRSNILPEIFRQNPPTYLRHCAFAWLYHSFASSDLNTEETVLALKKAAIEMGIHSLWCTTWCKSIYDLLIDIMERFGPSSQEFTRLLRIANICFAESSQPFVSSNEYLATQRDFYAHALSSSRELSTSNEKWIVDSLLLSVEAFFYPEEIEQCLAVLLSWMRADRIAVADARRVLHHLLKTQPDDWLLQPFITSLSRKIGAIQRDRQLHLYKQAETESTILNNSELVCHYLGEANAKDALQLLIWYKWSLDLVLGILPIRVKERPSKIHPRFQAGDVGLRYTIGDKALRIQVREPMWRLCKAISACLQNISQPDYQLAMLLLKPYLKLDF